MHATFPLIALATGAALPSPLRAVHEALVIGASVAGAREARGRARQLTAVLPARLQEDVRIVGALAELFATAAAERLMNAGLTLSSETQTYRRPSSQARRNAMRPTLPLIALAAGAALCTPLLAQPATPKRHRAAGGRPPRSRRDQARVRGPSAA